MNLYRKIRCDNCSGEYKIVWDDDNYLPPEKCAHCGEDKPEIIESGFMA
jgi:hypothetical protein